MLLSGIFALILSGNVPAFAAGNSLSQLEVQIRDLDSEMLERRKFHEVAYEFTQDLCYLYKFRKDKGLALERDSAGRSREDYLIRLYTGFTFPQRRDPDAKLVRSMAAWGKIYERGLVSPYYDGVDGGLSLRSKFLERLLVDSNFVRSIEACSRELGTDIYPLIVKELGDEERRGGLLGLVLPILPAGYVVRGLNFGFRAVGLTAVGANRALKVLQYSAVALGSYSLWQYLNFQRANGDAVQHIQESGLIIETTDNPYTLALDLEVTKLAMEIFGRRKNGLPISEETLRKAKELASGPHLSQRLSSLNQRLSATEDISMVMSLLKQKMATQSPLLEKESQLLSICQRIASFSIVLESARESNP